MKPTFPASGQGDILIVDDDLPSLRLLSDLLAEHGYEVRSARDSQTAFMLVSADPPDLILLDIEMPVTNGFQVCEQLKRYPESRDIPILFISARDDVHAKVKGFEVGGVDYINKPYHDEEILARIKTHLTISRLQAALVERIDQLSALHDIAQAITRQNELDKALEITCKTITHLFGVSLTLILLQENGSTELKGLVGFERSSGMITYPKLESAIFDPAFLSRSGDQALSAIQTRLDTLLLPEPIHRYIDHNRLQSSLIVPLVSRGERLGLVILAKDDMGPSFQKHEIELAETIANDIAAAIENDRLTEQAQMAAVDAERQRLARELHDSVTQSIYSLILLSSGWESMARQGKLEDPVDAFRRLGSVGQQALREMRLLLHQLRPSILEDEGLVKAIQQRLDTVEKRTNIDAQLVTEGNLDHLPEKVEDELYNIAQEALNNTLRHARAQSVRVLIREDEHKVTLCVEDDGVGFDASIKHSGMGLINIQDRVKAISGKLSIISELGHGTQITVSVDISQEYSKP
jgi:signal transduction histidine kinase